MSLSLSLPIARFVASSSRGLHPQRCRRHEAVGAGAGVGIPALHHVPDLLSTELVCLGHCHCHGHGPGDKIRVGVGLAEIALSHSLQSFLDFVDTRPCRHLCLYEGLWMWTRIRCPCTVLGLAQTLTLGGDKCSRCGPAHIVKSLTGVVQSFLLVLGSSPLG